MLMSRMRFLISVIGILCQFVIVQVLGHGRMMEPPNRSSLWRLQEYEDLDPPLECNYDDDQNYCGSLGNMVTHGGKCGVCGDPWEQSVPRPNENGGIYGQGLIVRKYKVGQIINIAVELTTNHWGYFTWSLCVLKNSKLPEPDSCFDQYPLLQLGDGSGVKYNLTTKADGWFNMTLQLPKDVKCDHCVLRWHYRAGNNWEFCDSNKLVGSTDCGYQEVFRSCSDIAIGSNKPIIQRPKVTTSTDWDSGEVRSTPKAPVFPTMRPPKRS